MSDLFKPLYYDTDSIKQYYPLTEEQRKSVAKCFLNAQYGSMVTHCKGVKNMSRDYIVVHRAKKPIIIFTKSILAIEKDDDGTAVLYCSENAEFYVDEKYADVIKQII